MVSGEGLIGRLDGVDFGRYSLQVGAAQDDVEFVFPYIGVDAIADASRTRHRATGEAFEIARRRGVRLTCRTETPVLIAQDFDDSLAQSWIKVRLVSRGVNA